jgi:type IV pilus assembly protein PilM
MNFFGLDIGSYMIKFVKVDKHLGGVKVAKIGWIYNPVGQILPGDKQDFEKLAMAIKQALKEHGLSGMNCHLALGGPQAYISIISMPALSDAELASAVKWEAEQHIPVSLDEVNFEYDVLSRPNKDLGEDEMKILLVGAPKKIVDRYIELLDLVGIEPIGLEPEVVSLMRSYVQEGVQANSATTLICNVGAFSTSFVVIENGKMSVAHSAPLGGVSLTRALEKELSLSPQQSEEYKRTFGLETDKLEGKVRASLLPVFDAILREIKKTIQYYVSKSPAINKVSRVIMCGASSNLPGLAPYLAEVLSVEVLVGNPFIKLGKENDNMNITDPSTYSVALGLALKDF